MTADSIEASSLDPETLMLVRLAALVAVDAPTISYLMNLEAASELDIDEAAEDTDHLISPEERLRVAMARQ